MAGLFQLGAYAGVVAGRCFIDRQNPCCRDQFPKPLLILIVAPRVRDSESVFPQDNDGQFDGCRVAKDAHSGRIVVGHSRKGVGVENHRRSLPIFGIDGFKLAVHDSVDAFRLFMKMLETAGQTGPGLVFLSGRPDEFLFNRFGDKGAQGDASLGGYGFGLAKDGVGDFKRGLHRNTMVPYLWEQVNCPVNRQCPDLNV